MCIKIQYSTDAKKRKVLFIVEESFGQRSRIYDLISISRKLDKENGKNES